MTYLRILLFSLIILCSSPVIGGAETLRIAYPEFKPFFHKNDNGHVVGIFHDIVSEALRRQGITAVWNTFPWARCQALVRSGDQDAIVTVPTQERAEYTLTHKHPFYLKKINVFTYSGHPRLAAIKGLQRIEQIREQGFSVITYTTNGWSNARLVSAGVRVVETPTLPSIWRMLANRRGDLVLEWPQGAWPEIRAQKLENDVMQTDVSLGEMPFHLLVRKTLPFAELVQRFDQAILEMRRDGTIDTIVQRYE